MTTTTTGGRRLCLALQQLLRLPPCLPDPCLSFLRGLFVLVVVVLLLTAGGPRAGRAQ